MKESSPEGNIKNYIIDDEGIARSQDSYIGLIIMTKKA